MRSSTICGAVWVCILSVNLLFAEDILRETFDAAAREKLFALTYGDKPASVEADGAAPDVGRDGAGGRLRLVFGPTAEKKLSYWSYPLAMPVPIMPEVSEISFWVKANVPLSMKIAISPFGFIYHGPSYKKIGEWEKVTLPNAYQELKKWCEGGKKKAENGCVSSVIVAVSKTQDVVAEIAVDDIAFSGPPGAAEKVKAAAFERKTKRVRVSAVSQLWNDEGRTLAAVLQKIDEAAVDRADIVALPQECVKTDGEPIPGPISNAIAEAAKKHSMYVIGNLRETDAKATFVTSFLCDRQGNIVGKYRKSHRMPDENAASGAPLALGDDLPVFDTDFGVIAMRIGTDRFFPDIDHVYTAKGAHIIFWSQMPEPVEDEYSQDFPSAGRAADYGVFIACSRYAAGKPGYITNMYPPYCGFPIGRAYVINREGQRIASTLRTGGGVATAGIPIAQLLRGRARPPSVPGFAALTQKIGLPVKPKYAKRQVRISIIEAGLPVDQLLAKLDETGRMGSDIVCLYELVWLPISHDKMTFTEAEMEAQRKKSEAAEKKAQENLARVAQKAKQYGMYVLVGGVVEKIDSNVAVLFDRAGNLVWRYYKVAKTHGEQIPGTDTPVYDTDFGRIAARICADEWMVELDRSYGVKGADILFTPTQSWGPDALFRDLRDLSRAMDTGMFLVQSTHPSSEVRHRSLIVDPAGVVIARSQYRKPSIVTAVVDLDNDRPLRFQRAYKPHKPGGYLPEYQPDQMPQASNDLREVVLQQRRPELYGELAVGGK